MILIAILVHKIIFYTQMYIFVTKYVIDKSDIPEITVILYVLCLNSVFISIFSDRRTLKFVSVQYNLTNKKKPRLTQSSGFQFF